MIWILGYIMSSEKDIANTIYNAAVVSGISLLYNMVAKKLIKFKPADLRRPDVEDTIKLVGSVALAMATRDYLIKAGYLKPAIIQ